MLSLYIAPACGMVFDHVTHKAHHDHGDLRSADYDIERPLVGSRTSQDADACGSNRAG